MAAIAGAEASRFKPASLANAKGDSNRVRYFDFDCVQQCETREGAGGFVQPPAGIAAGFAPLAGPWFLITLKLRSKPHSPCTAAGGAAGLGQRAWHAAALPRAAAPPAAGAAGTEPFTQTWKTELGNKRNARPEGRVIAAAVVKRRDGQSERPASGHTASAWPGFRCRVTEPRAVQVVVFLDVTFFLCRFVSQAGLFQGKGVGPGSFFAGVSSNDARWPRAAGGIRHKHTLGGMNVFA